METLADAINGIKVIQFWNPQRKKTQWCLLEDYVYSYRGEERTIEAGYVTDWASSPHWLWSLFRPVGKHDKADLEHDDLYDNKVGSRKKVDLYFYKRMRQCGLSRTNARWRYRGVRLAGKRKWND